MRVLHPLLLALAFAAAAVPARAADRTILLASTTSTENSGLLAHILPRFEEASGIRVKVVAVGTGQALKLGERGDADVLLLHHRPSEEAFVAAGFGIDRREVMANDFVLVGPAADPVGAEGGDVVAALRAIAGRAAPFLSRGDESGTHRLERGLWGAAGIEPGRAKGRWYRELGSGMGATLNTAAALGAYTLADRGSWASFANRRGLAILVEGDPRLFNPYGLVLVNPARHPHVKAAEARAFADWLTGPEGQAAIASFTLDGRPLFQPTASNGRRSGDG
jgi:tungstate transport system substrate-binding protein